MFGVVLFLSALVSAAGAAERVDGPFPEGKEIAVEKPGSTVTAISEVRRGQRVTLHGKVERIRDEDEFILSDESGKIRIYIGWKNDMPVDVGDRVTVKGRADDDVFPGMRPEVYATSLTLANGDQVNLRTGSVKRAEQQKGKD